MKRALLVLSLLALVSCGGQPAATEAPSSDPAATAEPAASAPLEKRKTLPLDYAAYRTAANAALKQQKSKLVLPENIEPAAVPDEPGTRKVAHHYPEGLDVVVETDSAGRMLNLRVIWHSDANPKQAKQLSAAAAVLLAAADPEDRSLAKDISSQIEQAVADHNQGKDPTRIATRNGITYKTTVTNLPSVVLTAQPE